MKKATIFAIIIAIMAPVFLISLPAQAALDFGFNYAENIGLGNADPRDAAVTLIQVVMTFLGIIAVVVILIGGFKWLTAAGNEDQVAQARKLIVAGIIGLIIIMSAWAITSFVVRQMGTVLN